MSCDRSRPSLSSAVLRRWACSPVSGERTTGSPCYSYLLSRLERLVSFTSSGHSRRNFVLLLYLSFINVYFAIILLSRELRPPGGALWVRRLSSIDHKGPTSSQREDCWRTEACTLAGASGGEPAGRRP